ncbi:MAG: hypothetical protein ACRD4Q_14620 [Candidatus Acidiferrales bacterium]
MFNGHQTSGSTKTSRAMGCRTLTRLSPTFLAAAVCFLIFLSPSPGAALGQAISTPGRAVVILRGTLGAVPGKGPSLETPQKNYMLRGQSPYLLRVLEDKRLLNQELQVEGTAGAGGTFVVDRIYAVRNGKLFNIQYYCEVCNITYVQPGHCYCCGRETKLQEVPVTPSAP